MLSGIGRLDKARRDLKLTLEGARGGLLSIAGRCWSSTHVRVSMLDCVYCCPSSPWLASISISDLRGKVFPNAAGDAFLGNVGRERLLCITRSLPEAVLPVSPKSPSRLVPLQKGKRRHKGGFAAPADQDDRLGTVRWLAVQLVLLEDDGDNKAVVYA